MMRARLNPAPPPELLQKPVVGVLLPLPLAGALDYKLPPGVNMARGALVAAPLGNREVLGAVWGAAEGTVGDNRLKLAAPPRPAACGAVAGGGCIFRRSGAEWRPGARRGCFARCGGSEEVFRHLVGWRHRLGKNRSLFRGGGGSDQPRQAGVDPASGNR